MTLLYPQFLWLLLPLGLVYAFFKPRTLRLSIHLLILGLLILTLSRPQLRKQMHTATVDAKEIIIALDVSYSMRAQDIAPDRYTYAKKAIDALLQKNPNDNIMLIAFTTNPLLLTPPTTDHTLVHTALKALNLENILTKGTSLKHLFQKVASFQKRHRELILLTDGGEEKTLTPLVDALKQSDTHLIILATGTRHGATVPKPDGTPLKDKNGNLVVSRINPLLKSLSDAAEGTYLRAKGSPQQSADAIMKALLDSTDQTEKITKQHFAYRELFQIPLLVALVLFLMLHTRAARYLIVLFTLLGIQLHASFLDTYYLKSAYDHYASQEYNRTQQLLSSVSSPSLQLQFARANTYYRQHRYAQAIALYKRIRSTSPRIKQTLYYNIANAYVMMKRYTKAKMYYTKALQLGDDADARHNLALVAQMQEIERSKLGIAHPKSQSAPNSKNSASKEDEETQEKRRQEQSGSGSGAGGQNKHKNTRKQQKKGYLEYDENATPQPLSSKVYELINKGYMRETQPW